VPRSWKSRAIPLHTLLGHTGSVTASLYLYLLRRVKYLRRNEAFEREAEVYKSSKIKRVKVNVITDRGRQTDRQTDRDLQLIFQVFV